MQYLVSLFSLLSICSATIIPPSFSVLNPANFKNFLTDDVGNHLTWAIENVPFFDCPDQDLLRAYYFRWTSYKKHIFNYKDVGYVVTEFLPNVPWAGKYNTIPCAAGHHIMEGRWLRNLRIIDDYSRFWFRGGGDPRRYTFWAATSMFERFKVTGNKTFILDIAQDLVDNFLGWVNSHLVDPNGRRCFWQSDGADGGEVSIGGSGCRPTINSVMKGEADALLKLIGLGAKVTVPTPPPPFQTGRFCCQTGTFDTDGHCIAAKGIPPFLFAGKYSSSACKDKCIADKSCQYYTVFGSEWCQGSINCDTTHVSKETDCQTYSRNASGNTTDPKRYFQEWSQHLESVVLEQLWNSKITSFATIKLPHSMEKTLQEKYPAHQTPQTKGCPPNWPVNKTVGVRELLAFIPWYFHIPPMINSSATNIDDQSQNAIQYEKQWTTVLDNTSFASTWGLRTAERSDACYNYSGTYHDHECNWNGPSWPYETSRVLTALANLLNDYDVSQHGKMTKTVYYDMLQQYTRQHIMSHPTNGTLPWIGEDIHPDDGYWIARWIMYMVNRGDRNRGNNYNHSTFVDLILSQLLGIRSKAYNSFVLNPLVPDGVMPWFAVDSLLYHGRNISIVWDQDGSHYGKGKGLSVMADGVIIASAPKLQRLVVQLPKIES